MKTSGLRAGLLLLFLAVLLFGRTARADVLAPELAHDPGVAYPAEALAEGFYDPVTVDLALEIDASGTVRSVTVTSSPRRLFDDAAVRAARALRFKPASRDGNPVAARITFRYAFLPPAPSVAGRVIDHTTERPLPSGRVTVRSADGAVHVLTPDETGSWRTDNVPKGRASVVAMSDGFVTQESDVELIPGNETRVIFRLEPERPPPTSAGAAVDEPTEVRVRGEKVAPGVSSFSRGEVRNLPGAFGDAFRAVETLPGVTPTVSGLPFFYVRGAPPGNVGYYLDGVHVPTLFHVGLGPSVVHPAMVERVDLYPGGYPSRFGRFSGAIVSAESTAPRAETHGEANLRVFDAGAMVETGFADGRGTVLLGGRYSYTAALVSLLAPGLAVDYRDYQARVSYDLGPRDRLTAFAFGSYDLLGTTQDDTLSVLFGSEFYRLDLRHDHAIDSGSIRTAVTLGYDQTRLFDHRNANNRMTGARTEVRRAFGQRVLLRGGADVRLDAFQATEPRFVDDEDPAVNNFRALFPARNDVAMGLWTDMVLVPTPGVEVTPGARIDHFRSGPATAVSVDPRLALRFAISERVRLLHAYGLAHQPPSYVLPGAGLTPGLLRGGLQRSAQASTGVEVDIAEGTTASSSVFYNAFFGMTDALGANSMGGPEQGADERSRGKAYGVELFVRRRLTKRIGGFVSYTLSRSERTTSEGKFPSAFDRTHVANAALSYDLGRNWRAGGRLLFYTGAPRGAFAPGGAPSPRTQGVERNPAFYRVDIRLEKRWLFGAQRYLAFVAEFMNVTGSTETFGDSVFGPVVIPSLGLEGGM